MNQSTGYKLVGPHILPKDVGSGTNGGHIIATVHGPEAAENARLFVLSPDLREFVEDVAANRETLFRPRAAKLLKLLQVAHKCVTADCVQESSPRFRNDDGDDYCEDCWLKLCEDCYRQEAESYVRDRALCRSCLEG